MNRLFYSFFARILSIFFALPVIAADSSGDILRLKEDAPSSYVVKKGDTLWDISGLYLDSQWLWPRLWQFNPEIDNPHLIYPGDMLNLVWVNNQPVLSLKPQRKISPKVRKRDKRAVGTLPDGLIMPYLKSDRLLAKDDYSQAQRVLGTSDGRRYLSNHGLVYVDKGETADEWGLYRLVDTFSRAGSGDKAVALKLVALAQTAGSSADYLSLSVQRQYEEIRPNDIVLPVKPGSEDVKLNSFYPYPVGAGARASIVGSLDKLKYLAANNVVIIDRGLRDNLRQGAMFQLYERGAEVTGGAGSYSYESSLFHGVDLPDILVGELMVIRAYGSFSLALVTASYAPISLQAALRSPLQGSQPDRSGG